MAVFLVAIGLFGGMLLLPLYYQILRGEGAFDAGLLLAPQGLGAIVAMIIGGRLTDRIGAGYVVPVGVVIALIIIPALFFPRHGSRTAPQGESGAPGAAAGPAL